MSRSPPSLLESLLHKFLKPPPGLHAAGIDDATWREAVGPAIVRRAIPQRLQDGTLYVRVATSAWAQQLSMLQETLREKLAERGYTVHKIRFSVGPVAPPRRLLGGPPLLPPVRPDPLPSGLMYELAQVHDHELRDVLARAAAVNLAWQKAIRAPNPPRSNLPGLYPPWLARPAPPAEPGDGPGPGRNSPR